MIFPAAIFMILADVQQHYMQSFCTELYQNWTMTVQSTDSNSCTPSSGASLSLKTPPHTHVYMAKFCKEFLYRKSRKSDHMFRRRCLVRDGRMSACGLHTRHSFCVAKNA